MSKFIVFSLLLAAVTFSANEAHAKIVTVEASGTVSFVAEVPGDNPFFAAGDKFSLVFSYDDQIEDSRSDGSIDSIYFGAITSWDLSFGTYKVVGGSSTFLYVLDSIMDDRVFARTGGFSVSDGSANQNINGATLVGSWIRLQDPTGDALNSTALTDISWDLEDYFGSAIVELRFVNEMSDFGMSSLSSFGIIDTLNVSVSDVPLPAGFPANASWTEFIWACGAHPISVPSKTS